LKLKDCRLKNNQHMELLRDAYATDLLMILAKKRGFEAEPAVIDLANDKEQFTLSIMQAWLRVKYGVMVVPDAESLETFQCKVARIGGYAHVHIIEDCNSFEDALEKGLKYAFEKDEWFL
jgi:hypothetical protein